ncbi:hypothetical protein N2152v2_002379 [Parachlorella kessleri]
MLQVRFISQTLADYREVRKIYHYDYSPEDLTALKHCATDLRPFTWSALPAGVTWWLSGRVVPTAGRPLPFRIAVAVARLIGTGQVFRAGYLAGSYRQTRDCMQNLVSLPTPLGGEIVALIRARNPQHPYLKFEVRPPGLDFSEEGRPRIATEENRLAQIAKFRRELATAKAGQPVQRGKYGEALEGIMMTQGETLNEVVNAREKHEEKRRHHRQSGASAGTAASSSSPQGLVITDAPESGGGLEGGSASHSDRPAQASAARQAASEEQSAGGSGSIGGNGSSSDFLSALGAEGGWSEEGLSEAERLQRESQERRDRRKGRWGRGRRHHAEASPNPSAPSGVSLEGSD